MEVKVEQNMEQCCEVRLTLAEAARGLFSVQLCLWHSAAHSQLCLSQESTGSLLCLSTACRLQARRKPASAPNACKHALLCRVMHEQLVIAGKQEVTAAAELGKARQGVLLARLAQRFCDGTLTVSRIRQLVPSLILRLQRK